MSSSCIIFFFKQKTAYEMLRSLVGSEMCIRDRRRGEPRGRDHDDHRNRLRGDLPGDSPRPPVVDACPLYTSDAADDPLRVDPGGRRIITKQQPLHLHSIHDKQDYTRRQLHSYTDTQSLTPA